MMLRDVVAAEAETLRFDDELDALLVLLGVVSFMGMPYSVLMPIFADKILHGGAAALGWLMGATGVGALIGALLLSTAPRAVVSTVAYPLATESAAQAELGGGVVIGTLNGIWAAGLVLAPLLAGALDQIAGPGPAYLAAIIPGLLATLVLSRLTRLEPSHALQVV